MENVLISTFKDLSVKDKRNEIGSLMIKMDMLLNEINPNNNIHREVKNYVFNAEDEDDYLNDVYLNMYNLTENLIDYAYSLESKKE